MAKKVERKNIFCFVRLRRAELLLGKELNAQTSIAAGPCGLQ